MIAVGSDVLGGHVDKRQQRGQLVRRRVTGGVQQREKALGEPQRIVICHASTLAPGEIISSRFRVGAKRD